jgi:hypothetical protein
VKTDLPALQASRIESSLRSRRDDRFARAVQAGDREEDQCGEGDGAHPPKGTTFATIS